MARRDLILRILSAARRLAGPVAIAAFFVVARQASYWSGAAWALVMMLAFDGWGRLVERAFAPATRADLGLRLAWGLAATHLVGGLACTLHVGNKSFLLAQVTTGCALSVALSAREAWSPVPTEAILRHFARPGPYIVVLAALAFASIECLGQLGANWTNLSDDQPLYYFLPQKLVDTGTILDPYDVRRMTTYGGQVYLHAQYITVGKHYQLNVVDGAIGTLMVMALVIGAIARRGIRRANAAHLAVALVFILTIVHVRFNIGSLMTGLAALIGTYRTLLLIHDETPPGALVPPRRLAVLAACAVSACVLRTSNAVPVSIFTGLAILARQVPAVLRAQNSEVRRAVRDGLLYAGLFLLVLLPWLLLFRQSAGTLVYPLDKGNMTKDFAILKVEPGLDYNLKHTMRDLMYERPIVGASIIFLAGMAPAAWGRSARNAPRDFVPLLVIVCFLSTIFTSYMGGAFDDATNVRYYFAFYMWALVAVILTSVPRGRGTELASLASPRALLVLAAVIAHSVHTREETKKRALQNLDAIERARAYAAPEALAHEYETQNYRDVQGHVPAGAAIGVTVDDPFRFDMRRNPVYSLDLPGGLGPDGFPGFQGPDVVARYLVGHGVRYFITVDYRHSKELYDLDRWRHHMKLEHTFLNYEAPFIVDAMESIDALTHSRRVVYKAFGMTVIDLAEPPAIPSGDTLNNEE